MKNLLLLVSVLAMFACNSEKTSLEKSAPLKAAYIDYSLEKSSVGKFFRLVKIKQVLSDCDYSDINHLYATEEFLRSNPLRINEPKIHAMCQEKIGRMIDNVTFENISENTWIFQPSIISMEKEHHKSALNKTWSFISQVNKSNYHDAKWLDELYNKRNNLHKYTRKLVVSKIEELQK